MVTYTNRHKLPQYLEDWIRKDNYDYVLEPNTYSATSLMKPLQAALLAVRHADKLEVDIIDLIASRYGNAIHDSVERVETPGVSKENRITRKLMINDTEYTVSGKYDILVDNKDGTFTLRDMKSTSTWSYIFGGKDSDYQIQLSIYRWLLSTSCNVLNKGYIDFFFTDWQGAKAKYDNSYPQHRIKAGYEINLLSLDETERYIRGRLEQIDKYRDAEDIDLPPCHIDELWGEPDTFAVYKIGNKKATKVCDSKEEAVEYMKLKGMKESEGFIQNRQGKIRRCKYCPSNPVCSQAKTLHDAGLIAD